MKEINHLSEKISNPGKDKKDDLQKHIEQLQSLLNKELDQHKSKIESMLPSIVLPGQTLALVHFLAVLATKSEKDKDHKYDKKVYTQYAQQLIKDGSLMQIQIDAKKFGIVTREMLQCYHDLKEPIRAIKPLQLAITRLNAKDHLTPQHAQLTLACIWSKTYKVAIPYLDAFVFQIDPQLTGVRSEDTRLYFYYGAICYIAGKHWIQAGQFLETVISSPALMPSAIQVDAYKKYVLVSLIHKGEVPQLPRTTSQQVSRACKQLAGAYEELATSFQTRSYEDAHKCVENGEEVFIRDHNMGLVRQALSALHDLNIKALTKTYMTSTLKDISDQTTLPPQQVEVRILKLVEKGQLSAKIHKKEGYVAFQEQEGSYASPEMVSFLETQIKNTLAIHTWVVGLDRNIEAGERYLTRQLQGSRFGDDDMRDLPM